MPHHTRARTVLLATPTVVGILALTASCAHSARGERIAAAAPAPATTAASPITGHPPVTTSGVVARYDPSTDVVTFKDGRVMKLTDRSIMLQPVERRAVRPGEAVIVRDALPVGVQAPKVSMRGKRQRMATVASVDEPNRLVRLTDGTAVHVTDNTNMRMGTEGATVVLTELRPGDELLIVVADVPAPSAGATAPNALPRAAIGPSSTAAPGGPPEEASELMVFRSQEAP